jgi:poly(3-hydroxybutyrate) depolymerase
VNTGGTNSAGRSGGGSNSGGAGAGGASGAGSSAGAAGSGGATTSPSPGCGTAAAQALNSWVKRAPLRVNGKDREWWVWLPTDYDPKRAYPLVFTFHGCGGPDNFLPMQRVTGDDAILVRGTGISSGGCWTYGPTGDDVLFFDAMLAEVGAKHCMDTSRVFATGYSSGAWLVNTLGCARGDKLRATGSVSGGVVGNRGTCKGKFARSFVHDEGDTTNKFIENGNRAERDRIIAQNHCSADVDPVPETPAPCARYQGCDDGYPVIMCLTQGKGHERQDTLATSAFWKLFSEL